MQSCKIVQAITAKISWRFEWNDNAIYICMFNDVIFFNIIFVYLFKLKLRVLVKTYINITVHTRTCKSHDCTYLHVNLLTHTRILTRTHTHTHAHTHTHTHTHSHSHTHTHTPNHTSIYMSTHLCTLLKSVVSNFVCAE